MDERDGDDVRNPAKDAPPGSDTFHEGVLFEGLRPPLTLEQRRRRTAITSLAIVGVLAVLFGLPSPRYMAPSPRCPHLRRPLRRLAFPGDPGVARA